MKEKIKKIVDKKTAIHITSMKQLEELRKIAIELGITPLTQNGSHLINKGDFCVVFKLNRMYWCEKSWCVSLGYKVINFDDLRKNECIVIYRKDNEVIALDKSTGKKAVAKCSPEDTFDFKTGAKIAFDRLTENVTFKVGDRVKVTDSGQSYPLYIDWVEIKVRNCRHLRYKFDYGNRPDMTHIYEVEHIEKHLDSDDILAYIKDYETNRCYVINVEGLEKC